MSRHCLFNRKRISEDNTSTTLRMQSDGVVEVRDPSAESVRLRVISDVYGEHLFEVKITSRIKTLMKNYSRSLGAPNSIDFMFNGRWVKDDDTPVSLGMRNNDFLLALSLEETGVRCASTLYCVSEARSVIAYEASGFAQEMFVTPRPATSLLADVD